MVSVVCSTRLLICRFTDPAQILFIQQAGSLAKEMSQGHSALSDSGPVFAFAFAVHAGKRIGSLL
jgi:hypothetical protein